MNYLQREWSNYQDKPGTSRVLLVGLSITEDCLRWFSPKGHPRWLFMPIWKSRGWLSEGRKRRRLRRFISEWAKNGIQSEDYFYEYEHKRQDRKGQIVRVSVEWIPDFSRRTD